jgi:hypothetical protein
VVAPVTARAGVTDIISLLNTIGSTIQSAIGQVLAEIQVLDASRRQLEQQLIWPLALINQTKSFVSRIRAQLGTGSTQIHSLKVNSATLLSPKQLETVLRSGQSASLPQLPPVFVRVFAELPAAKDAGTNERNLIDLDDAVAQEAFKTAIISDQSSEQMLRVADAVEQHTAAGAAGTASMMAGQAEIANLQSQALFQKLLAAELRQEAVRLAHSNTLLKQSAVATRDLSNHLQQILTRP